MIEQEPRFNPEQNPSREELRAKLKDPNYLPKRAEIHEAFGSDNLFSVDWDKFCHDKESPVYELLNQEYIQALSGYIRSRVNELGGTEDKPVVVLEVGAGNGRLTHFLVEALEVDLGDKVKIVATDRKTIVKTFPVEQIEQAEALKKYNPDIVISSWMPYEVDFTKNFRDTESVNEYILIGEPIGGNCGHPWLTWGETQEEETDQSPPYAEDGFTMEELDDLSKFQVCRTDRPDQLGEEESHSSTVSFMRVKE